MERYYQPEIETASIEEIYRIQNERLINTVNLVYYAVPFYRDMMDRAGVRQEDIKSR